MTAIEFENISKQYRLGLVSTKTLSNDIHRFWVTNVLGKEDPYLKIGDTNDRSKKAESDYVWALRDINFKVEQGDVLGIIGKNGAGKSTLLKLLSKVTGPTTGSIKARGRIGSLLEVGTGFHSEMTGRENIYLNGAILGMTRHEIARKLDEIVDFSGCERYIDTPVKRYSSGMMVRLGFAVAAHLDPEILVVDEVLAVGDAEFQKKAIGKMRDVSAGEGRTVLFVSHNMASVRQLCTKGILLNNGTVQYSGDVKSTIDYYLTKDYYLYGKIVNDIQILDDSVQIFEVVINGKEDNELSFNGQVLPLTVTIRGASKKSMNMAFESFIYDSSSNLLASYCPTYSSGKMHHVDGNFLITEQIPCPSNICSGTYHLSFCFTNPHVKYYTRMEHPVQIVVADMAYPDGTLCSYASNGFIRL